MNIGISLLGFGNVNRTLVKLIKERNNLIDDDAIKVISVVDKKFGSLYSPAGIQLDELLDLDGKEGCLSTIADGKSSFIPELCWECPEVSVMCEAIFTNPKDGEPALSYCRQALESGVHVCTTNKGPVAFALKELESIAAQKQCEFLYEGSVMSGTPVLSLKQYGLPANKISRFEGLLNGTANFVLSEVEAGASFSQAIKHAQELGYAEANPQADIEGSDVHLKVMILVQSLLELGVEKQDISCEGIENLSEEDVRQAVTEGYHWKLVGRGELLPNGKISASVKAQKLPISHPLATVSGATNALYIKDQMLDGIMIQGPGAGRVETAYALLSDLLRISH
ncbi:homoserine dehydrogenase [uncultured Pseudoteredinibacter sp.]|uniref:homoserine dehydrogenase n=1 Tax=uncultured Pseudoteredinibacter sp. TaxID=1641701 RepID=UPI0026167E68|nr:homoserine dehydrogenase [uncultured Pseudoteredinibacter sp.]